MSKVKELLQKHKKLLVTHLIALGILLLGLILCRYVFLGVHGMKEWPVVLFQFGLVALLVSLLARKQCAPWFTSVGYLFSFWVGVLFHTHGFDPGGGKTDNLWGIWMVTFLVCIFSGFLLEVILKWYRLLKKH